MNIQWVEKGRPRRIAAFAVLLAAASQIVAGVWQGLPLWKTLVLIAGVGGFAFAVFATRVELRSWWALMLEQVCVAGASVLALHGSFFQYTDITIPALGTALCIAMVLQMAVYILTSCVKWFDVVWLTLCMAYGLLDVAIYQFSGNVITISDIRSIGTALNVADSYFSLKLLPSMVFTFALYACSVSAVLRIRIHPRLRGAKPRALSLAVAALFSVIPVYVIINYTPVLWQLYSVRSLSIPMSYILEAKSLHISKPENYSQERVAGLAEAHPAAAATASAGDRPHVIAIMIESFSDLTVLGDFETDAELLPNLARLSGESVHGQLLVSTYGGGTSRSEWEFLTGNSMGLMPPGCTPYCQFMRDGAHSIVELFENAGYRTVGMHPYHANGWDRDVVYPLLGFDDIYFLDDLDWGGNVRKYVSDSAFVHQVIELFEDRDPDAPMFLFGVTMQDHSSYSDPDFEATVHLRGMDREYPTVEQYLSLANLTDEAIGELIAYFSECDEKVQIVLFGDHQPRVPNDFFRAVGLKDEVQKFIVPFVMWDNYEHRTEEVPVTSVNYLASRLLDLTGIQKPAWYSFLSAQSEAVPAMNHLGCVVDGSFAMYDDDLRARLGDYAVYQYANLFDDASDDALFVGAPEG